MPKPPQTPVPLGDIARINPPRPPGFVHPPDDSPAAFVPMAAVQVDGGGANPILRPYAEVRRGYTFFQSGDVMFAKITPCMQNGKHFIAPQTPGGFGFASTEFHVIRPEPGVLAEWIHFYLRQPSVLAEAAQHFSGAVGQQRVPDNFLRELKIPLPPLAEQKRIVKPLSANLHRAAKLKAAMQAQAEAVAALPESILSRAFPRKPKARLGDVCEIVRDRPKNFAGEKPYYSTGAIATGERGECEMVSAANRPSRANILPRLGDVGFAVMKNTAKAVLVDAHCEGAIFSTGFCFLRPSGKILPEFLCHWVSSGAFQRAKDGRSADGIMSGLRTADALDLEVPLPPLAEQRIIALSLKAKMRIAVKLQAAAQAQLEAAEALPGAWLRRAFSDR